MPRPDLARLLTIDGVKRDIQQLFADEATAVLAGGADTGRASAVREITFDAPGAYGQHLRFVPGESDTLTYLRVDASFTADTGPWTDIGAGPLTFAGTAGTPKTAWLRYVVKRWTTGACPTVTGEVRVQAAGMADFTG